MQPVSVHVCFVSAADSQAGYKWGGSYHATQAMLVERERWSARTPKGDDRIPRTPKAAKRGKLFYFALWLRSLACVLCAGAEVLAITDGAAVAKKPRAEIQCFKCKGFGHYYNRCPAAAVA